jgi:hypothetical protein
MSENIHKEVLYFDRTFPHTRHAKKFAIEYERGKPL